MPSSHPFTPNPIGGTRVPAPTPEEMAQLEKEAAHQKALLALLADAGGLTLHFHAPDVTGGMRGFLAWGGTVVGRVQGIVATFDVYRTPATRIDLYISPTSDPDGKTKALHDEIMAALPFVTVHYTPGLKVTPSQLVAEHHQAEPLLRKDIVGLDGLEKLPDEPVTT